MSKFIVLALLLFFLIDISDSKARTAVSRDLAHKCGCKVFPNGMLKCRSQFKKAKAIECLCRKMNKGTFSEVFCKSRQSNSVPISLM